MPVDSSAVQIVINVTDGNSGEVISRLERSLGNLGQAGATSGRKMAQEMERLNVAAPALRWSMKSAGAAAEEAGGHFQTAFDRVRLLRTELGVRMPRAMESVIARNAALMGAINALGGVLVGIGAVGIFVSLGQELKSLWDRWFSLSNAVDQYNDAVQKSKDEDFGNTRSIEDTRMRIDEATGSLKMYQKLSDEMAHKGPSIAGGIMGLIAPGAGALIEMGLNRNAAKDASDKALQAQAQLDKLNLEKIAQQHQLNTQQIEYNHALDGSLRGHAKIAAALAKQRELNSENVHFSQQMDAAKGNDSVVDVHELRLKNGIAQRQADAETFNLNREQTQELWRLKEEALEAGLRGSALYAAQEAAAIEDLKNKDMDSAAARAAVHEKFHAEEMKRLRDEARQTQEIQARAAASGLKGIAKTQAEGEIQIGSIRGNDNLSDAAKDARVAAARETTKQQILTEEQQFAREVDQVADSSATHQISGFARIRAEASKQLDELQRKFDETYGQMDHNSAEYQRGLAQLGRGQNAVHSGAAQQSSDLARRNADETAQIEAEANAKLLSAEKQKTAAIETEYDQRLQKYREQLDQQEISQDDFNRRVLAAGKTRDAELAADAAAARQKLAGELAGFFRNPLDALKSLGDKMAGEAAASLIQNAQARLGRHGDGGTGTGIFGGLGSIFGGHAHAQGGHISPIGGGASSTLSVASAMIQVGSASISLGGFAGAPGNASAGGLSTASFGGGFSSSGGTFGGAGASSLSAAGGGFTGSGPSVSGGGGIGGIFGGIRQGAGAAMGLAGLFRKGGSTALQTTQQDIPGVLNADGTYTSTTGTATSGFGGSMMGGGGFMSNLGGAAGGAMGLFGAYEGNGGIGGAAQGGLSGAKLGMSLAGPVGAAIGAVGGAIFGAIGFGGRHAAHIYDIKQVRPQMKNDLNAYEQGTMDYLSAYTDMETLMNDAKAQTKKMGPAAQSYYQDTIKKELKDAEGQLTRMQKVGRSQFGVSAAQYAIGTDYVPRDGMAMIHEGERIVPSDMNERITRAMEGGVMPAESSSWGGDIHVHAIDAKSGVQWLMQNKHVLRAAINASYAENSGGADA